MSGPHVAAHYRAVAGTAEPVGRSMLAMIARGEGPGIVARLPALWLFAVPVACTAAIYARFFGGYWLGDDFANLHRAWLAAEEGELWSQVRQQFFAAIPAEGAFYRPLVFASVSFNEWIAGAHYAGWFAVNLATHVLNTALVAVLVMRLARMSGCGGRLSGMAAAAFFGLCPLQAEGVFWISARSDASVTLLTLFGVLLWARAPRFAVALPLCLIAALGFKESAAVLPLQMTLVALAWPERLSRQRIAAVVACFVLVGVFLAIRAQLFGGWWHVYPAGAVTPLTEQLTRAAASIAPWWRGLSRETPATATLYLLLASAAIASIAAGMRGARGRLALALLGASAGLAVASLQNLGALSDAGEGGRLTYTPAAWLALALGVGAATPVSAGGAAALRSRSSLVALLLLAGAAAAGTWMLQGELRAAISAERGMLALVRAAPDWAIAHPGLTLLVVGERIGPVVTGRNAQALVLPPVQRESLLHRILPTSPREIGLRHAQLSAGLGTRLAKMRPLRADAAEIERLLEPDVARWPEHYACWSQRERRIVAFAIPDPADRARWSTAVLAGFERCKHPD